MPAAMIATHYRYLPRSASAVIPSSWRETGLLVLVGSLLVFLMTQPAFRSFFFSETFEYLGQYRAHHNQFWRALFSPTNEIFFRPIFFVASLPWYHILPLDPWAYHLRNFFFVVINLVLLHRILMRLVISPYARAAALLFFALSKVHLTTIGYINLFDSTVLLLLLLSAILFFLRYIASRQTLDYCLGLLFCFASIFSKDYGLVIVAVVAALVVVYGVEPGRWRTQGAWWAFRLAPLLVMVLLYLGIRHVVVGSLPSSNPIYSPQLSLNIAVLKILVFAFTLGNLSFTHSGATGASGLGAWLTTSAGSLGPRLSSTLGGPGLWISWGDAVLCVALLSLLTATVVRGRQAGWTLLFPMVWIGAYFAPTLLTRNIQMYYHHESLAGIAVLLGLCLDRVNPRLLRIWGVAIVLIGINGAISNYTSLYTWQFVANAAQRVEQPVVQAHRGQPIESVTFVTSEQSFWKFALGSDRYPLVAELMKRPRLRMELISYKELPERLNRTNSVNLLFDIDNGFLSYPDQIPPPLVLREITPGQVTAGNSFNVQSTGQSALQITTEQATPGTVVVMGETQLGSHYADPTFVSALVPGDILTRPGRYPVYLTDGVRTSDSVDFVVKPNARAPTPSLGTYSSPSFSGAKLVATPNPVPAGAGVGTTTITWSTGNSSSGQVYVSENGGREKLFAEGTKGSQAAPWISAGTYEFRLYAGKANQKPLATVKVTRNEP